MNRKLQLYGSIPAFKLSQDNALHAFKGSSNTGIHIAALKCLLAFAIKNDFNTRKCSVTLDELETLTGLSRPMVIKGYKCLEGLGYIQVEKEGCRNIYTLATDPEITKQQRWFMVPKRKIEEQLATFPNRGKAALAALKIYIQLLASRPNQLDRMNFSYNSLVEKTGVYRQLIPRGLDILYNNNLITVLRSTESKTGYNPPNQYTLLGIKQILLSTSPKRKQLPPKD